MLVFLHTHFCTHTQPGHTFVVCATISTCILLYFVYVCKNINMSYFFTLFMCAHISTCHTSFFYVCKNINMPSFFVCVVMCAKISTCHTCCMCAKISTCHTSFLYVCTNINMSYFFTLSILEHLGLLLGSKAALGLPSQMQPAPPLPVASVGLPLRDAQALNQPPWNVRTQHQSFVATLGLRVRV